MNVIISNKYQSLLATLDVDIIKSIQGVFSVDEIVVTFSNFYYNKFPLSSRLLYNILYKYANKKAY